MATVTRGGAPLWGVTKSLVAVLEIDTMFSIGLGMDANEQHLAAFQSPPVHGPVSQLRGDYESSPYRGNALVKV